MSYFEYFAEDLFSVMLPYLTYKDFDNLYEISTDGIKRFLDRLNYSENKYKELFHEEFPELYKALLELSEIKYYNNFWKYIYDELIELTEDIYINYMERPVERKELDEFLIYDMANSYYMPNVLYESFIYSGEAASWSNSKKLYNKVIIYNKLPWCELYQLISAAHNMRDNDLIQTDFINRFSDVLSDMEGGAKLLLVLYSDKKVAS